MSPDDLDDWCRGDPGDHVANNDPDSARDEARTIIARYIAARPNWYDQAECFGVPPDVFFPTTGIRPTRAIGLCGMCTVREQCLDEALADPTLDFGIRGGLTATARRQRRRSMKRS